MRHVLGVIFLPVFFYANVGLTTYEQQWVDHIQHSITEANEGRSKLSGEILKIDGMSSSKVRHFLNNLCAHEHVSYLEIGCYKGSTWISSLYANQNTIDYAVAIDNWSEFSGPKAIFLNNCQYFLEHRVFDVSFSDSFKLDVHQVVKNPINVYFYDGNHSEEAQELAFTYYDSVLENVFVAIVDDWNWDQVQRGTKNAFQKLGYTILFEKELPANHNGDRFRWWNGLYVALIRK